MLSQILRICGDRPLVLVEGVIQIKSGLSQPEAEAAGSTESVDSHKTRILSHLYLLTTVEQMINDGILKDATDSRALSPPPGCPIVVAPAGSDTQHQALSAPSC